MSVTLIMNEKSDDIFSVIVADGEGNLFDVSDCYTVNSATMPDGREGLVLLAKEEEPTAHIDPFDMPDLGGEG